MNGSKLYFIATKQGFVVKIGPRTPWIFTRDIREAQPFESFNAADMLMKESKYDKHYAVLTVPEFSSVTAEIEKLEHEARSLFSRGEKMAFLLGGVFVTSLVSITLALVYNT